MVSVEAGENEETEDKGGAAIETLLPEFVSEQTYEVDAVSGATVTSKALKNAVGRYFYARRNNTEMKAGSPYKKATVEWSQKSVSEVMEEQGVSVSV